VIPSFPVRILNDPQSGKFGAPPAESSRGWVWKVGWVGRPFPGGEGEPAAGAQDAATSRTVAAWSGDEQQHVQAYHCVARRVRQTARGQITGGEAGTGVQAKLRGAAAASSMPAGNRRRIAGSRET
jgi:hypothetical protein